MGQILGSNHARTLTILIGLAEILMAIWIVLKFKPKLNAIVQIVVVITMNIIETFLAPELLLWGKFNLVFAALFVLLVYYNQFKLSKQ